MNISPSVFYMYVCVGSCISPDAHLSVLITSSNRNMKEPVSRILFACSLIFRDRVFLRAGSKYLLCICSEVQNDHELQILLPQSPTLS